MAYSKKVVKMFTVIRHISRAWGVKLLLKQPFGTIYEGQIREVSAWTRGGDMSPCGRHCGGAG